MIKKVKRWFWGIMSNVAYQIGRLDICELCEEEIVDGPCVGCGRRICMNCDSLYYDDETLCVECRKDITPDEEEEDRKLALANEDDQ